MFVLGLDYDIFCFLFVSIEVHFVCLNLGFSLLGDLHVCKNELWYSVLSCLKYFHFIEATVIQPLSFVRNKKCCFQVEHDYRLRSNPRFG